MSKTEATKPTEHVAVMDGLRGLAVTFVVLFHYWQMSYWMIKFHGDHGLEAVQWAGFVGVELFFFISGFCLFFPYANGKVPTLRHFYYRRAIKILPSYVLALAVFGYVFTAVYPSTWHDGKLADLAVHLVFLQNFVSETHSSVDGVMWSLAVEVQFYVLFPAIAWVFRRRPFPTFAVMLAISVAYRAWNRHHADGTNLGLQADFLPAFLDLFGFGMLAAWLVVWVRQRPEAARRMRLPLTAAAVVAAELVVLCLHWVQDVSSEMPREVWESINRPYLGLLFLIVAVASAFAVPAWRAVLSTRVLVFLSTISYNLYLWHQGIGQIILKHDLWPAKTPIPTDDPHWRWTYTLVGIGASIIIATLITYLFERPLLRNGVRGSMRRLREMVARPRERAGADGEVTAGDKVAV